MVVTIVEPRSKTVWHATTRCHPDDLDPAEHRRESLSCVNHFVPGQYADDGKSYKGTQRGPRLHVGASDIEDALSVEQPALSPTISQPNNLRDERKH